MGVERELQYARCYASRFDDWLVRWMAWEGLAIDDPCVPALLRGERPTPPPGMYRAIWLLSNYVHEILIARALYPHLFPSKPDEEEDDGDEEFCTVRDEEDAMRHDLYIVAPEKSKIKPEPNLPGCWGFCEDGVPCPRLRRHGDRFCPRHMKLERRKIRSGR
jgi:hypothetical protein